MDNIENIINYTEIGDVRYVLNRRARNLSIRINQQGEVRVTIPRYLSRKRAEAFLMSKKHWILKKLSVINHNASLAQLPVPGDTLRVRGKEITLSLQKSDASAEDALWRVLLLEARAYLPDRVSVLASAHDIKYTGLKIRKMKTRWGSCTAKDSINLNSWLMMLPDHLSDYVILHELVHTRHRDHSPRFWDALDQVTDRSSKQLRNELRAHRIMFLAPGLIT